MSPRGGAQRIPRPASARPGGAPPWARMGTAPPAIDLDRVRAALNGRGPGAAPLFTVPDARAAAVLVPLFEEDGAARVVLTRRAAHLRNHRGDVAFPGGRQDQGEDLVSAALREAHEEVGIEPDHVDVIGELDGLTTVSSGFVIAPFVGVLAGRPVLRPNPAEIERVFDVALAELLEDGVYREETWDLSWGERAVSFFELEDETIWGATARMLRQLLAVVTGTES